MISNECHHYDSQWRSLYLEIRNKHPDKTPYCTRSLNVLLGEINRTLNDPLVNQVSDLLLNTPSQNYDPVNDVDFVELLSLTWSLITSDLIDLFKEQYTDILNGTCSQGRTTRIFQILVVTSF